MGKRDSGPISAGELAARQEEGRRKEEELNTLEITGKRKVVATRETVRGQYENLESDVAVAAAMMDLRRGYPDSPTEQQCQGKEFREKSAVVTDELAKKIIAQLSPDEQRRAVVLMPWRAGLAFAGSFGRQGIGNFYHLSSKRDEHTLNPVVDFEAGEAGPESVVIVADPMLATGGSDLDAISRIIGEGVKPENIIVSSVVAAPIGVAKIKELYPGIRIFCGALDEKIDQRGYIVPGLGDFGDKYFAGMKKKDFEGFIKDKLGLNLEDRTAQVLLERFLRQRS